MVVVSVSERREGFVVRSQSVSFGSGQVVGRSSLLCASREDMEDALVSRECALTAAGYTRWN